LKTSQGILDRLSNKGIARHPHTPTWLTRLGMSQTDPHCFSRKVKEERTSMTVVKFVVNLRELLLHLPS